MEARDNKAIADIKMQIDKQKKNFQLIEG